jgi:hypothetical protein
MYEKSNSPEMLSKEGRLLEGEEREKEIIERREYVEGLEEMLERDDLSEEECEYVREQYEGLKEFLEGMEAGEEVRIIKE